MYSLLRFIVVGFAFFLAAGVVAAGPTLGKLWLETQMANPERGAQTGRGIAPLAAQLYRYEGGVYRSLLSRIALPLPTLADEAIVSVRESVVSRRPDGSPITTHVIFVPGPLGIGLRTEDGVSAVVVTRLRDDRPKDRESVLKQFEPPDDQARAKWVQQGVSYLRIPTALGETVQRMSRNRIAADPFPYRAQINSDDVLRSVGGTRYVVVEGDSLIEFSQVFPCGAMAEAECQDGAVASLDRLVSSVKEFLVYPSATGK